jgi:regulator of protease activity HflC (stomatin/prohibitin superfamily)
MIIVCCVNSKDVRLPVQLQRAMAAEAEAAREARAKVCSTKHNAIIFILSEI